jgi:hypothetical protein
VVAREAVAGGEARSRWSRRRAAALLALAAALIAVALVSLPTPAVSDTCFCGLAHDEVVTVKITDELR